MKKITFSLIALLSITSFSAEIKNKELRSKICKEIISQEHSLNSSDCLSGKIEIVKSKAFKFDGKEHTVLMNVNSEFKGSLYQIELSRSVMFQHSLIKFSQWHIVLVGKSYGDETILLKADINDDNVVLIDKTNLPDLVRNWSEIKYYKEEYAENELSFYLVKNSSGKLLGYIGYISYADEDLDIKGYLTQNFDLEGNLVGSEGHESFGYHE